MFCVPTLSGPHSAGPLGNASDSVKNKTDTVPAIGDVHADFREMTDSWAESKHLQQESGCANWWRANSHKPVEVCHSFWGRYLSKLVINRASIRNEAT